MNSQFQKNMGFAKGDREKRHFSNVDSAAFYPAGNNLIVKHDHTCKFIKTCKTLDERYPPHLRFASLKRACREFFLISEKNGRKCNTAKGKTGYIAEKEEQLQQPRYMIHPYSKFRECLEILVILEFCLGTFFRHLLTSDCSSNYWYTSSYHITAFFADVFETLEAISYFFVGYIDKSTGNVVFNKKKIFIYKISDIMIIFNFIGSLPLEFMVFLINGVSDQPEPWKTVAFIKILKVLLISRYLFHVAKIHNWSELTTVIIWGIVLNFLMCHWITCLYHQLIIFDSVYGDGGLSGLSADEDHEFLLHYAKILHAVSAVLLDRNVILRKFKKLTINNTIFWFFIMPIIYFNGIITFGLIIFYSAILKNSGIYYEEMKQEVQKFLVQENLPRQIHKKVKKYLEFRFRSNYFDEELIFKTLSPPLKREVASFLCMDLLKDTRSIFKDLPIDVATEVCLQMKYEVVLAGDIFFRGGSKGDRMYFLYSGSVAVYSKQGREVMHWYEGQQFGVSAFVPTIHPATVLALEMSECYCLRYKDFLKAIAETPECSKIVTRAASYRRQYVLDLYSEEFNDEDKDPFGAKKA